jgi:uncharacterized protein (DUF2252 family)
VGADLVRKHQRMRESAFVFLRATFYRWMQVWPERCAKLDKAPTVLGIGDLHIENFGTWRDEDNRLAWGVNDVDEACEIPYTSDLVRLATSAILAIREGHLAITAQSAYAAILDGYATSLERGGDPKRYWAKLLALPRASGKVPRKKLQKHLPDPKASCVVVHRIAGAGSLGRRRFVAIAKDGESFVAREAKALLPSAAAWARGDKHPKIYVEELLEHSVRVPDPSLVVTGNWMIRRIAPDCARIELSDLPVERDERKLLRAMGWETANVHVGSRRRKILKHLHARKPKWLEHAAEEMAAATTEDFRAWTARR